GGSESSASTSDRISLDEDGYYDELFEDLSLLKTIRAPDGNGRNPFLGTSRPFFARLFSSAARLDLSDLRTRVSVNGSASQKVYVDPESDHA
ncbi:hypothetical protein EXE48_18310, partial [Halorubrum sp. ASP1]